MKIHILQLETHDDVVSVRDRMAWSKAGRVLMVWPRRGAILHRQMDLVLLQRCAQEMGAQLGLITRDPVVRAHAQEIGLPVFSSLRRAQQGRWQQKRMRRPAFAPARRSPISPESLRLQQTQGRYSLGGWWNHPLLRLAAFTLAILSVLALVMFFLPSARITLKPSQREQSAVFPVWASPAITSIGPSGGMPAREVTVSVEGQDQIETSGSTLIATRFADGTVRFANLTGQPITVPAGLVVRTLSDSPARFITTADLNLSAGPHAESDVPVRALQPGAEGNVNPGEIKAVEGEIGLRLTVTNPQALQGGQQANTRAVTAADVDRLRERLLVDLSGAAIERLTESLGTSGYPISSTVVMRRILKEDLEPPVGQAGDVARMTLRVEYAIWVVSAGDLQAAAQAGLDASLPPGYETVPGTLAVVPEGEAQYIDGRLARWQVRAVRQVRGAWTHEKVVGRLLGLTPAEASRSLQTGLALAEAPDIQLHPSWWVRMPSLPFRIEVLAR